MAFRRPASVRHWWPFRVSIVKPVAGVPGDRVCMTPEGLTVHGRPYGPVLPEVRGQPLPVAWGCSEVPPGHVFVAVPKADALDSRYFGPVSQAALTGQMRPLLTQAVVIEGFRVVYWVVVLGLVALVGLMGWVVFRGLCQSWLS